MIEKDSQEHIRGARRHLEWIHHAILVGSGLENFRRAPLVRARGPFGGYAEDVRRAKDSG
jgi:hypothetical protein